MWAEEIARAAGMKLSRGFESSGGGLLRLSEAACRKLATDLHVEISYDARGGLAKNDEAILWAADTLDAQLAFAPYGGAEARIFVDQLMADYPLVGKLRVANRSEINRILPRLPVYPAAAVRTLERMADPEISVVEVEKVAAQDQVLAGKLIAVANSAYFAPEERIGTIARAISHIGLQNARRVVMAEAVRPLFTSKRMRAIWVHSIRSAKVAERIAEIAGYASVAEAFVAGLVHDVGRLAMTLLPETALDAYDRVVGGGCEQLLAETVLFGFDHADAGGEILAKWHFPTAVSDAVKYHHSPELTDDVLASILYLTEFWTEADEEPSSGVRMRHARELTGVSMADLAVASLGRRDVFDEL
jgi:putative nucleotidyltransferase with HDIG domain